MSQCLSKDFLFQIRNHIPINDLITKTLKLPSKKPEGIFYFLCPICLEFRATTNHKTNLARCFRCERNFNTIDLTMLIKGLSFLEAIQILTPILRQYAPTSLT